jgi:hypothetical protein
MNRRMRFFPIVGIAHRLLTARATEAQTVSEIIDTTIDFQYTHGRGPPDGLVCTAHLTLSRSSCLPVPPYPKLMLCYLCGFPCDKVEFAVSDKIVASLPQWPLAKSLRGGSRSVEKSVIDWENCGGVKDDTVVPDRRICPLASGNTSSYRIQETEERFAVFAQKWHCHSMSDGSDMSNLPSEFSINTIERRCGHFCSYLGLRHL